ncbi:MAG: hypothetical protein A2902_06845 [Elusimicrobia bacterium RIFCSPLOWO2_01_FULL_64_13]|nr:MAG: hypothetical protein A2902_06845 [Elusimicrobia bacterium RIFCSPLOWO2_01_FULL_64_13]
MNFWPRLKKYGTVLAVLVLLGLAASWVADRRFRGGDSIPSGSLPEFEVAGPDGKPIRSSDLKGKVSVVDFWATWCGPCVEEVPHFNVLHERYAGKGLAILGISMDDGGAQKVRAFVRRYGVAYPVAMANDQAVKGFGGIFGLPTTFIIDREGRIVEKIIGYRDLDYFDSRIRKLL